MNRCLYGHFSCSCSLWISAQIVVHVNVPSNCRPVGHLPLAIHDLLQRRVNEPYEGATMNCNLVICHAIWCLKQSWLGGRASDRHVSRNKLYFSALTPAETLCPYGVHTNFSISGRISSGTSQPHLRAINAEQKASDSTINPKGFVFRFPLKAFMSLHHVKNV